MLVINCYHTISANFNHTGCELTRKSYETGNPIIVLVPNEALSTEFDNILWSYSRKYFIPHATSKDPLPNQQPILITTDFTDINQAQFAILLQPTRQMIIETMLAIKKHPLQKIILLINEQGELNLQQINDLLQKSCSQEIKLSFFHQESNKNWQQLTADKLS